MRVDCRSFLRNVLVYSQMAMLSMMMAREGEAIRLRGRSLAGEDLGKMRVEVRKCQLQRRVQA
jgi:hypothetical protein